MTKADIVNEITKNTGIDKTTVLTTVEAFMPPWMRALGRNKSPMVKEGNDKDAPRG